MLQIQNDVPNINLNNYLGFLGETTIIRPPEACGNGDEGRHSGETDG